MTPSDETRARQERIARRVENEIEERRRILRYWWLLLLIPLILAFALLVWGYGESADRATSAEETKKRASLASENARKALEESASAERQLGELSKTAQEALDRAVAAGRLAEGKFLYETVFGEEIHFLPNQASLRDEAKEVLSEFAEGIKSQNADVEIEIQGHTDPTEPNADELGLQRARSVRRYLYSEHGLPLSRMAMISLGADSPVVESETEEGSARNRRVQLVVLK